MAVSRGPGQMLHAGSGSVKQSCRGRGLDELGVHALAPEFETRDARWVEEVLDFWFDELSASDWFVANSNVDDAIGLRFADLIDEVAALPEARLLSSADVALAAIIVLDQFPRNLYRGRAKAFEHDARALTLARVVVDRGLDLEMRAERRILAYLPFEHSEDLADQDRAVVLIEKLGDAEYNRYAEAHRDVIRRFGRFPHRNAALGRASTEDEEAYLAEPGSGF